MQPMLQNVIRLARSTGIILMKDPFTGTVVDTAKWTVSDPLSRITQNGDLQIAAPHTVAAASTTMDSIVTATSGVLASQLNITWTTDSVSEAIQGLYLYVSDQYRAQILSRSTTGGTYRLQVVHNNIVVYDVSTAITKGKDIKVTYNFTSNEIKFWYWSGSAWTQMGTTQTYNLGSPIKSRIWSYDEIGWTGANPGIFDTFYMSSADYSTQYPT